MKVNVENPLQLQQILFNPITQAPSVRITFSDSADDLVEIANGEFNWKLGRELFLRVNEGAV